MTRWRAAPPPAADFQRHHVIPHALIRDARFAQLLAQLAPFGFDLRDYASNGLSLPASEDLALTSGRALHRGPHAAYNDVMAARIARICADFDAAVHGADAAAAMAAPHQALFRLRLLQRAARRALTDRHRLGFQLNRRDPMRLFADRAYLDRAIAALYGP